MRWTESDLGIQPGWNQRSGSESKDEIVRCWEMLGGSKRELEKVGGSQEERAFRHIIRLAKISELQKDETPRPRLLGYFGPQSRCGNTRRVSLRFSTRVRQHAFALRTLYLLPKPYSLQTAQAKTLCKISSNTLSEIFDELVSATPFAAFAHGVVSSLQATPLRPCP